MISLVGHSQGKPSTGLYSEIKITYLFIISYLKLNIVYGRQYYQWFNF